MVSLSNEQVAGLPDWLPVRDFEGLYEVNCREGLVRSLYTGKILKANPDSDGYPVVNLCKNSKAYTKKVHRIVALTAFEHYGIQTDGLLVMHLDEERFNPKVSNLALGTCKENMAFPKARKRRSEVRSGEKNHMFGKHFSEEHKKKLSDANPKKRVVGAFKEGRLIFKFESTMEAEKNGFNHGHICACCRGKRKHHHGYEWRFI